MYSILVVRHLKLILTLLPWTPPNNRWESLIINYPQVLLSVDRNLIWQTETVFVSHLIANVQFHAFSKMAG